MDQPGFHCEKQLKSDALGSIELGYFITETGDKLSAIKRGYATIWWIKPLSYYLARNERRAIFRLNGLLPNSFPQILQSGHRFHIRSFIAGDSMHHCPERLSPAFWHEAKHMIKTMRRVGVCNNDLSKEANWIITPNGHPAVTDFQLALCFKPKRKLLRILSREDLRHLLKHKRKYSTVSAQEQTILNNKSGITHIWTQTGKRLYRFITRRLLGWQDRTGPEERDF